jgi:hypothetical protein
VTGRRLLGAIAGVLVAACALALAHDVRSWSEAMDRGDARFESHPEAARWRAKTWLPGDPARRLLGLDDDVRARRAEQAFRVALAAPEGFDNGADRARLRGAAELLLADVVGSGTDAQASRAGNLLGILVADTTAQADAAVAERQAADTFQAAIRASSANVDAKYNLELLLRRIRVVGTREGPGSGSGTRGDSRQGAGAGTPGSGY